MLKNKLLLHALSIQDRILEPNSLPLLGRVWVYSKDGCSKDLFVGHCVTMLSRLGLSASDIQLRDDVMAFDASSDQGVYTIVISLADDSLASQYFYFIGIWKRVEPGRDVTQFTHDFDSVTDDDDELPPPECYYEVFFSENAVQLADARKALDGEMMGQTLFNGNYSLVSNGRLVETSQSHPLRFVVSPRSPGAIVSREEVKLILYSIRNLVALMCASVYRYNRVWPDDSENALYQRMMVLMQKAQEAHIPPATWDELVRENGATLLGSAELAAARERLSFEVGGYKDLFDSIVGEVQASDIPGLMPLWPRMRLAFDHAQSLLSERLAMIRRSQKQAEVLLQLIHSRMLAHQQSLLANQGGFSSPE
jgi:hypothetical protein